MIDIAVSINTTNACSGGVSASIRVSVDDRGRHEEQVEHSHRDRLGVGPLLPDGGEAHHLPGVSSVELNLRAKQITPASGQATVA